MLNLFLAMIPKPDADRRDLEAGFLGKLLLWARAQRRYRQSLAELNRLSARELDDLAIGRDDFPALAHRHLSGAAPLAPSQVAGLRRL
jgi:uncharacterized protein YjiS (DUF1127 family)